MIVEENSVKELRRSLLSIPELRDCFAEEIVIREALEDLFVFDFFENETALLDGWKVARRDIASEASSAFERYHGNFLNSDLFESRYLLFLCALRKFDAHFGGVGEHFEPCEFLGGDPYKNCLVDGVPDPIKLGNCVKAEYSMDVDHISRVRKELDSGRILRAIEQQICPFMPPEALINPREWELYEKRSSMVKVFRSFERNYPIPAYLTANENFTLSIVPSGCRIRAAALKLSASFLPERLLHLFGISLYETEAMVEFFEAHRQEIQEYAEQPKALDAFLIDSSSSVLLEKFSG